MNNEITGAVLRDAVISAANVLASKKKSVDELNVFPVPDGDTGTNMSMTISNAALALKKLPDSVTASQAASEAASGMLRGARGNSGVILSILFRGFSKMLEGQKALSSQLIVSSLESGVEGAYRSVMKPTEGTILTVAREACEAAKEAALSSNDPCIVWDSVCRQAALTLEKTPSMLDALKRAGVVDAGGKGLLIVFEEMGRIFKGGEIAEPANIDDKTAAFESFSDTVGMYDEQIHFTYCTEMIITKQGEVQSTDALRAYLETIGDCVVVVSDDEIIKVHVHTNDPGLAIQKGLEYGEINLPKVENMRLQHENKKREAKRDFVPAPIEKQYGFVAVAAGSGIEAMFKDAGADCVVRGGQTMNPSTEDILEAIMSCPAETVFVLPNNKNIIMAAEQAMRLADRRVCVLQTRTIPQGISAMLAFDESADLATNRLEMTNALERVTTGQVTFAARDSDFDGHHIKQGELLCMIDGKLALVEHELSKAAYRLTKRLVSSDTSFLTILYGADVTDEAADALYAQVSKKYSDLDINMMRGGQPVYYYIISAE